MLTVIRSLWPVSIFILAACQKSQPRPGATAERVALDTVGRAWHHAAGVDSVRQQAETTVVWVSPRNWMGTDAPQAGVHVDPRGRIVAVQWIYGG
jgi:hypothetical protein